jgi:hypothetical protein
MIRGASSLLVVVAVLLPSAAAAQTPWVPPKGAATIGANYQWLDADRHLFSNLTEPALTRWRPFAVLTTTRTRSISGACSRMGFSLPVMSASRTALR